MLKIRAEKATQIEAIAIEMFVFFEFQGTYNMIGGVRLKYNLQTFNGYIMFDLRAKSIRAGNCKC